VNLPGPYDREQLVLARGAGDGTVKIDRLDDFNRGAQIVRGDILGATEPSAKPFVVKTAGLGWAVLPSPAAVC